MEVLRNNYRSHNLIGHNRFWVISPRNSTSFTRLFLTGRRVRAGHKTILQVTEIRAGPGNEGIASVSPG